MSDLKAACVNLVERSVLTLAAMPDPDARFRRGPGCSLPEAAVALADLDHEARLGLKPRDRGFRPSPRDVDRYLEVLGWLGWLARDSGREVKVIVLHAFAMPAWRIAQRFRCSERTVQRWRDGGYERLVQRWWRDIDRLM